MRTIALAHEADFAGWRRAARTLLLDGIAPGQIEWTAAGERMSLFGGRDDALDDRPPGFTVPREMLDLARLIVCHRDPERFALLYELLFTLRTHPHALEDRADPRVYRLHRMAKAVRRDMHKMHAFVRFREIAGKADGPHFVAWFEPEHHIVRATIGFFVRRFTAMRWSILTPEVSMHWDGKELREGAGACRRDAPDEDELEAMWKTYYAAIFNPARVKIKAMTKEMPKKYWRNMPETSLIPSLIAGAQAREAAMIADGG